MIASSIIQFDHLSKYYGPHIGIEDLSFSIGEGDIFGFLGPNGAGKTTTIRLMLDLLKPSSGSVRIFNKEVKEASFEIRKRIGYLPGNFTPYDKMKGHEFLRFSLRLRNLSMEVPGSLFKRFDLSERDLQKKIRDYSQGMKQKLGILHAVAHDPDLIILDEPSAGLDPIMQDNLYELLNELHQRGKTLFFSSHNLPEVEKVCERVAIVKMGKLVGNESLDSLRKKMQKKMWIVLEEGTEVPRIEGAKYISTSGNRLEYLIEGDLRSALLAIHQLPLTDVVFPEPSLEDIFLGYYDERRKNVVI